MFDEVFKISHKSLSRQDLIWKINEKATML